MRECNKSPQAAAKRKEESSEIISLTVPSTYIILIHVPKFFFLSKTCEPPRHYITECGSACCCHQSSASAAAWPPPLPSTPLPRAPPPADEAVAHSADPVNLEK